MSTTIQIKRSSTASGVPLSTDLAVGELAVNLADKRLFTKQSDGTIIELSTNPTDLDAATLRIDGVEITASAAELNKLDGFTGSTAELNLLDGLTATTIELNTLDGITASTAELNKLDGYTGSTAELNILDGVTATTAELNYVDGVTSNIQTQLNNKQPLDAQLTDVAGLTPADGSFIVGNGTNFVTESGNTAIASLGVTATAAELNTLDGITSTTAELNILDGVTATATEINVLDGITATTTELNYTDGVTSNIQTQLDGKATSAQGALADSAVQPNDNVSFGTGSFSGEISANGGIALGDNDKATFGASDDLQIYSDGTNSIIKESGTGSLNYEATNINFKDATGTDFTARFITGGDVRLYHDGSQKLATTSTGVDVTGTIAADAADIAGAITADGLTVDGAYPEVVLNDTRSINTWADGDVLGQITFKTDDAGMTNPISAIKAVHNRAGSSHSANDAGLEFYTSATTTGTIAKRVEIEATSGDVLFFEDTGTTAKMVWDASAESLGIGGSPTEALHISNGGLLIDSYIPDAPTNGTSGFIADYFSNQTRFWSRGDATTRGGFVFKILENDGGGQSDAMNIDSSGNVGIGTASPGSALSVATNGGAWATSSSDGVGINYNSDNANISTYLDSSTLKIGAGITQKNGLTIYGQTGGNRIQFDVAGSERARLDSSGNLLVGKTNNDSNAVGFHAQPTGNIWATSSGVLAGNFNRKSSDGEIIRFQKDASTVGSIGTNLSRVHIGSDDCRLFFDAGSTNAVWPWADTATSSGDADNTIDLGDSVNRFKDLYLSGGVYLGGTGSANKLDDYEEGTFTPIVRGISTAGTATYSYRYGSYVKVGKTVFITMQINWTNITGSSGYLVFGGLPFTVSNNSNSRYGSITLGYAEDFAWGTGTPSMHTKPNDTLIYIGSSASGGNWNNTAMDTSGHVIISGTYQVA